MGDLMALWDTKCTAKPHTHLYHNAKSQHHPSNKQVVLSILVHRARALCDEDALQAELVFLRDVFKQNGYNDWQIHRILNHSPHFDQSDNKSNSVAFLPFVGTILNRISKLLARYNIKSVGLPYMKLSSLLHPVRRPPGTKDTRCLQDPLRVQQGLHWADGLFCGHQVKGAPTAYHNRTSGQVGCS
jgi:hypothetical protein